MLRWIIHVDMDAFFASVEQRDHPEYRGKPVIVGGLGNRGVVSTASYEARRFGVHSALPMATARRLCPQGIFLPGDHRKYSRVSGQIMAILDQYSPLVEQISVDEAFLDVTGMEWLYPSPVEIARAIKRQVKEELLLTVSAGVAPNKFLAKMASDLQKPDGLVVVEHGREQEFLRDLPVEKLWGIGDVTAKNLHDKGIRTIGQLARLEPPQLKRLFGENAATIHNLALGRDDRPVVSGHEAKSIGAEETFERDLFAADDLRSALLALAERVGYRLRREKTAGRTITLKLRYGTFQTLTRRRTLTEPTQIDEIIYRTAVELLEQQGAGSGVRLLGVTVSQLETERPVAPSLFDNQEEKGRQLSAAVDQLRRKFGAPMVVHGRLAPRKEGKETKDD
ncbi:MAG: DNA polymerase IV [Veillonellaceae bacterium]|nr:DNA polymerase IV [Veillonellaceae bacterium]